MHMVRNASLFILAILYSHTTFSSAQAASPYGTWLRPSTGVHIKAYKCKNGLGMKIVKASKPENVGKVIMCNAKADGKDKWQGEILNLDDGKTYSGSVELVGKKKLKLEGCILGGLFCKGDVWDRLE